VFSANPKKAITYHRWERFGRNVLCEHQRREFLEQSIAVNDDSGVDLGGTWSVSVALDQIRGTDGTVHVAWIQIPGHIKS
jgi:hypothetical protein